MHDLLILAFKFDSAAQRAAGRLDQLQLQRSLQSLGDGVAADLAQNSQQQQREAHADLLRHCLIEQREEGGGAVVTDGQQDGTAEQQGGELGGRGGFGHLITGPQVEGGQRQQQGAEIVDQREHHILVEGHDGYPHQRVDEEAFGRLQRIIGAGKQGAGDAGHHHGDVAILPAGEVPEAGDDQHREGGYPGTDGGLQRIPMMGKPHRLSAAEWRRVEQAQQTATLLMILQQHGQQDGQAGLMVQGIRGLGSIVGVRLPQPLQQGCHAGQRLPAAEQQDGLMGFPQQESVSRQQLGMVLLQLDQPILDGECEGVLRLQLTLQLQQHVLMTAQQRRIPQRVLTQLIELPQLSQQALPLRAMPLRGGSQQRHLPLGGLLQPLGDLSQIEAVGAAREDQQIHQHVAADPEANLLDPGQHYVEEILRRVDIGQGDKQRRIAAEHEGVVEDALLQQRQIETGGQPQAQAEHVQQGGVDQGDHQRQAGAGADQGADETRHPLGHRHAGEGLGDDIGGHHGPGGVIQPQGHGDVEGQHGGAKRLDGKESFAPGKKRQQMDTPKTTG